MSLGELFKRRLLFVGGKGGVGKTTIASALSLMAAEQGRRCLIVSVDPAHSLGDIFDKPLSDAEVGLVPYLWGLEIDSEAQADRYIATVKANMRNLVRPAFYSEIERQMELARLAPGALEAALLERMAEIMVESLEKYHLVIFDTAPTGHTLRLLSLPEAMAAWTDGLLRRQERSQKLGKVLQRLGGKRSFGGDELSYIEQPDKPLKDERNTRIQKLVLARRRKFHRARRLLLDSDTTAFILVLNPEKLPILESKKTLTALQRFQVPVAAAVINRVMPETGESHFWQTRQQQEVEYLREIEREFSTLPRIYIPLLPHDIRGINTLEKIGRLLVV